MSSFQQLHDNWAALHATFAQKIGESETSRIISSDLQYATAAWHNRLKVWCEELDELMAEYSPEFEHANLMSLRTTRCAEEPIEHPQDCDAARFDQRDLRTARTMV